MTNGDMIKVSKKQWDLIDDICKGTWECKEKPEWKGRNAVMGACISDNPDDMSSVLVEGIHFVIIS